LCSIFFYLLKPYSEFPHWSSYLLNLFSPSFSRSTFQKLPVYFYLPDGKFPSCYKPAQVLPLLKKAGLDSSSPVNYRPISNLSTISKILERLVLTRLRPHLFGSSNFSQYQLAYRTGHSTETALLEVLDGVYTAADDKLDIGL